MSEAKKNHARSLILPNKVFVIIMGLGRPDGGILAGFYNTATHMAPTPTCTCTLFPIPVPWCRSMTEPSLVLFVPLFSTFILAHSEIHAVPTARKYNSTDVIVFFSLWFALFPLGSGNEISNTCTCIWVGLEYTIMERGFNLVIQQCSKFVKIIKTCNFNLTHACLWCWAFRLPSLNCR